LTPGALDLHMKMGGGGAVFITSTLPDFSYFHWKADKVTLAGTLLHLMLVLPPLNIRKITTFNSWETKDANVDSVEQILIGQRARSFNWKATIKLYAG
jgi:hypothetical protein